MGCSEIKMKGYLSVEAALVMPIVFLCYFAVVIFMCYLYERCIWEQNACRLPLWVKFVEGEAGLCLDGGGVLSEEETIGYVEQCAQEEEKTRYLFGSDVSVRLTRRGGKFLVRRSIAFPLMGEGKQEFQIQANCPEPVTFLRAVRKIELAMQREGEKTEQTKEMADDKK